MRWLIHQSDILYSKCEIRSEIYCYRLVFGSNKFYLHKISGKISKECSNLPVPHLEEYRQEVLRSLNYHLSFDDTVIIQSLQRKITKHSLSFSFSLEQVETKRHVNKIYFLRKIQPPTPKNKTKRLYESPIRFRSTSEIINRDDDHFYSGVK